MRRTATIIDRSPDGKRCLAVDDELAEEILAFIQTNPRIKKKFRYITQLILQGHRTPEIYDKEDIEKGCEGVMAMTLLKGAENARIYCREVYVRGKYFVVIACEVIEHKSSQKNSHREKEVIRRVATYEYVKIHEP
ncbi:MAG TPA: hypothetical protein PL070_01270 [Flavobacteriales bacterium]|nr:hypothetical protein [Flavobacteriales bacterium]